MYETVVLLSKGKVDSPAYLWRTVVFSGAAADPAAAMRNCGHLGGSPGIAAGGCGSQLGFAEKGTAETGKISKRTTEPDRGKKLLMNVIGGYRHCILCLPVCPLRNRLVSLTPVTTMSCGN